jgi:hypothetical protein
MLCIYPKIIFVVCAAVSPPHTPQKVYLRIGSKCNIFPEIAVLI